MKRTAIFISLICGFSLALSNVAAQPLPAIPVPKSAQTITISAAPYVAQTAFPARRQGSITIGSVSWNCAGNRCTASGPAITPTVSACAELARQVGAINSYTHGSSRLTDLVQCNLAAGVVSNAPATASPGAPPPAINVLQNPATGMPHLATAPHTTGAPTGVAAGLPALQAPITPKSDGSTTPGNTPAGVKAGMPPLVTPGIIAPGGMAGAGMLPTLQRPIPQKTEGTTTGGATAPVAAPAIPLKPLSAPELKPGTIPLGIPQHVLGGPIRTVTLQFRGSGASLAEIFPLLPSVRMRTVSLQFRGSGASLAEIFPAMPNITVHTLPMQFRGTATLP